MSKIKNIKSKVRQKSSSLTHLKPDDFVLHPDGFGGSDYELPDHRTTDELIKEFGLDKPLVTEEENKIIQNNIYSANPIENEMIKRVLGNHDSNPLRWFKGVDSPCDNSAWIQTYSGIKFNPINPLVRSIVIQDVAHSLAFQCRFNGHCKYFYSVAQHCVLVSYICDSVDALWGLLHDAPEAYLTDIPTPLKQTGNFSSYILLEKENQNAICQRFELPLEEPLSVKRADKILLATEARDLMSPLHPEWKSSENPLPFKIDPLQPLEAKELFMNRFCELTGCPKNYKELCNSAQIMV